jgi:hypothetical protein
MNLCGDNNTSRNYFFTKKKFKKIAKSQRQIQENQYN